MHDLRRIRYVAGHYEQLQGLRLLPLCAPFLVAAGRRLAGAAPIPWRIWAVIAAASLAATLPIGRWYTRRFGRVHRDLWRSGAGPLVGAVAVALGLLRLQEVLSPTVSLPLLFLAAVFARLGLAGGRARVHYAAIAAAVAAYALLPAAGVPPDALAVTGHLLAAGCIAVAAIGDHRVLRRTMAPQKIQHWEVA